VKVDCLILDYANEVFDKKPKRNDLWNIILS
jgi:hypothetical protein